jgi:hypothetical protein
VGKLVNVRNLHPLSSPPPIQKDASWGSSGQLPHHLYRIRPRGEVTSATYTPYLPHHLYRKMVSWGSSVNFPTTYIEYGLVGKLADQLPHHLYRGPARAEVPLLAPPHHLWRRLKHSCATCKALLLPTAGLTAVARNRCVLSCHNLDKGTGVSPSKGSRPPYSPHRCNKAVSLTRRWRWTCRSS